MVKCSTDNLLLIPSALGQDLMSGTGALAIHVWFCPRLKDTEMIDDNINALSKLKAQAKRLLSTAHRMKKDLTYGQALEYVAAVHGFENWHACRSHYRKAVTQQEAQARWAVYDVTLYLDRQPTHRAEVLAPGIVAAQQELFRRHCTPSMQSRTYYTVNTVLRYHSLPGIPEVAQWLRQEGLSESALDELVYERSMNQALPGLNEAVTEVEQEEALDISEALSCVNNAGMLAQLEYLQGETGQGEFICWLRQALELKSWPAHAELQAEDVS